MSAKSKSPTVRALDELKAIHIVECGNIRQDEYAENERLINAKKAEVEKKSVEMIVKAITSLDIPFVLEHKTLCNIRNYNGNLRLELSFDARKSIECKDYQAVNNKIVAQRKAARENLDSWYLSNLYNIAGRETISEFKV